MRPMVYYQWHTRESSTSGGDDIGFSTQSLTVGYGCSQAPFTHIPSPSGYGCSPVDSSPGALHTSSESPGSQTLASLKQEAIK